jgi:hypothetical protein
MWSKVAKHLSKSGFLGVKSGYLGLKNYEPSAKLERQNGAKCRQYARNLTKTAAAKVEKWLKKPNFMPNFR